MIDPIGHSVSRNDDPPGEPIPDCKGCGQPVDDCICECCVVCGELVEDCTCEDEDWDKDEEDE